MKIKTEGRLLLKRSKSYDSTISNIIVNEINNRKNTNLHFIGYCEWLRCSSCYNELASLKWKNYIFPSEHHQENLSKNEKTIKNAGINIKLIDAIAMTKRVKINMKLN